MRVDTAIDYTVTSTVTGQKIGMRIGEGVEAKMMAILTNLYSDPERAIIREYATNALDSHIEAGQTRPIEVTLPTQLTPYLTIQDWGIGMSIKDIEDIYSQYGVSTKEDTNEQTGMLGLGCKSALTYAPQFSLIASKDGITVQVSVGFDDDGIPAMTIVSDPDFTGEPNGVQILIPAKDSYSIRRKAEEFFSYWEPGTVLLNGEEPSKIDGLRIDDDMIVVDRSADHVLVMGGVPYPIDSDSSNIGDLSLNHGHQLIVFVPIGSVTIAPDREGLRYTRKTKRAIAEIVEQFEHKAHAAIQKEIDQSPTPREAFRATARWHETIPVKKPYTYQGQEIPYSVSAPTETDINGNQVVNRFYTTRTYSSPMKKVWRDAVIPISVATRTLWIYGYEHVQFTAVHKRKLNKYVTDVLGGSSEIDHYAMHAQKIDSVWIPDELRVSWETIKAIKLPRKTNTSNGTRISGSYDVWSIDESDGRYTMHYGVPASDIDTSNLYFLSTTTAYESDRRSLLTTYRPGATIAEMSVNRLNKFQRDFPMATRVETELKKIYSELKRKVPKKELIRLRINRDFGWHVRDGLNALDPDRVDDPALAGMVRLYKSKPYKKNQKRAQDMDRLGSTKVKVIDPLKKYPLFNVNQLHVHPDHIYMYLNAVYANEKEEG